MSDSQNPIPPQPEPNLPPPPPPGPGRVPPLGYETVGGVGGIEPSSEARTFGMLCHLLALAGYIIPFGNIIGPLVMWLIKKDQYPFVDDQGKESLNFQITMTIAAVISGILVFVLVGMLLLPLVILADLILVIVATVAANQGTRYRYPFCLRLIK